MRTVAFFLAATIACSSHATLIGLGGSTLDTSTGLRWLDVTATQGMSPDDLQSSGYLASGWRLASTSEFASLTANYLGGANQVPSSNIIDVFKGAGMIGLFGITLSVNNSLGGYQTVDPNDPWAIATLGYLDDFSDNGYLGFGSFVVRVFDTQHPFTSSTVTWDLFSDFYRSDRRSPQVGAFLVSTEEVHAVPEPGTLSLFAAGVIALGFMRRRVAPDIKLPSLRAH